MDNKEFASDCCMLAKVLSVKYRAEFSKFFF